MPSLKFFVPSLVAFSTLATSTLLTVENSVQLDKIIDVAYTNVKLFNGFFLEGDKIEYNIRDTQCKNLDEPVRNNIRSAQIDLSSLSGCWFYQNDDCQGPATLSLDRATYVRIPAKYTSAASMICYPVRGWASIEVSGLAQEAVQDSSTGNALLGKLDRPDGHPNGTVILYTYPNFSGQYTKFRVFASQAPQLRQIPHHIRRYRFLYILV